MSNYVRFYLGKVTVLQIRLNREPRLQKLYILQQSQFHIQDPMLKLRRALKCYRNKVSLSIKPVQKKK